MTPAREHEGFGANKIKRACERESTMLAELMPIIFEITSELEKRKGKHPPTYELDIDKLNFQCRAWEAGEHNRLHGTDLRGSTAIQNTLIIGLDQWVLFFRESGVETAVDEYS